MKHTAACIVFLCFLFACGDPAPGEQAAPADTTAAAITADTAKNINADTIQAVEVPVVLNDIPKTKDASVLLRYFVDKYSVNYKSMKPDGLKVHVLSRFSCEKKYDLLLGKKVPLFEKNDTLFPVMELRAYVYTDSAQCANALNNWLNCFGSNCEMVQPGQNTSLSANPGFYIINETNIVCLDYQAVYGRNNWKNVFADLRKLFASKQSRIIEVDPKGELSWLQ